MEFSTILGAWVAVFLTLGIFSYLYKDNPFYKMAEHLFVGISAGYWTAIFFWTQIQPNLFGRLFPAKVYSEDSPTPFVYNLLNFISSSVFPEGGIDKGHDQHFIYLIPLALGVMMLLSLIPSINWFARWGIAYTVGIAAGLKAYGYLSSNVLSQISASAVDIFSGSLPLFSMSGDSVFNNIIILVGTISALMYFYFSREQTGSYGKFTRLGIYFLMISFGASFGFAVMGRISLLIGRFNDLILFSSPDYNYGTYWMMLFIVVILGFWSFQNPEKKEG